MARVRFLEDFDFRPTGNSLVAYLAGMEETVKRKCADEAIAQGKAVEAENKRQTSSSSASAEAASSTD